MKTEETPEQSIAVIEQTRPAPIVRPMPEFGDTDEEKLNLFHLTGVRAAAASNGAHEVLVVWLRSIPARVSGRLASTSEAFAREMDRIRERTRTLEARLADLTRQLTGLEAGVLPGAGGAASPGSLEPLRKEIRDESLRRAALEARHQSPRARIAFTVETAVLLLLTAYLYLFYVNAGYAAFSKNLGESAIRAGASGDLTQLFDAFFDPRSFLTAVSSGNLLLLLFPFVFIAFAVGFHLALESETGRSWKAAGLGSANLVVDVIMAYLISANSHDIQVLTGLASGPFGFREAIQEPRFWIVIFLGVVVAVLWGLLYGAWMKRFSAHEEREIATRIREREAEIARRLAENERLRAELTQRVASCREELGAEAARFAELEEKGRAVVLPWDEVERRCNAFLTGWVSAISALAAIPMFGLVSTMENRATGEDARRVGLQTIESMRGEQRLWVN